ncbi:MAG: hypothetical protein NVS9B9_19680 [Ktedonobacteraceae bacterium]
MHLINHPDPVERKLALKGHGIGPEHLLKVLATDEDPSVRKAAVLHPAANNTILHLALKDKDNQVRNAVLDHPLATDEHFDEALKDEDFKYQAVTHHNVKAHHLHKIVTDHMLDDHDLKQAALQHPNIAPTTLGHIIEKGMELSGEKIDHDADYTFLAALAHPKTPVDILTKASRGLPHWELSVLLHNPSLPEEVRMNILRRLHGRSSGRSSD